MRPVTTTLSPVAGMIARFAAFANIAHDTTDSSSLRSKYQCVRSRNPDTSPTTRILSGRPRSSAPVTFAASCETDQGEFAAAVGDPAGTSPAPGPPPLAGVTGPAIFPGSNGNRDTRERSSAAATP